MKVLITGANGFIGGALLGSLEKTPDVTSIFLVTRAGSTNRHLGLALSGGIGKSKLVEYDGSVESLLPAVKESTYIFHLGAYYSPKGDTETVKTLISSNIAFSADLFQAVALGNPTAKVISTSTFSAWDENYKYSPSTIYAATKAAVEVLASGFQIPVTFLRLPDTYGPADWRPKVHNLLRDSVLNKAELFSFQKPENQIVNLIHINDVVRALLHTAQIMELSSDPEVQVFDLFYGANNITLGEIADLLIKGGKTAVSFPLIGETSPLPPQQSILPHFHLTHDPHKDLAQELYMKTKER